MKIKKTTVKVNGGSMYLITFDSLEAMRDEMAHIRKAMERYFSGKELLECYKLMNTLEERVRYEEKIPDVLDITSVIYSSEAESWLGVLFRCAIDCGEEIEIAQLKE